MSRRRLLLAAIAWLTAALLCAPAARACAFAETGGTLAPVSSFVVRSGPVQTASAYFEFACSGVVLAALTGAPSVSATVSGSLAGLTLKNGTESIPYTVTGAGGQPYGNGQVVFSVNGTAAVGLLTAGQARVPVNIVTGFGPNLRAGTYTDTLTVLWSYQNICEGLVNVAGLCLGTVSNGVAVARTLVVSLTVTNDCAITAPDIQFGSAPLLTGFATVSQNIGLLCTRGLVYTVGISPGANPVSATGRRQMASGTDRLQYDVFKPDATVWGATGPARAAGAAAADGIASQLMPYTARIYTDQPPPAAGVYGDSLVIDVGF